MFCKICGKELNEHAFACPGCGCLVDNTPPKRHNEKTPNIEIGSVAENSASEKKNNAFKLFLFLSVSLVALSIVFSVGSLIYSRLFTNIIPYNGYNYIFVSFYAGNLAIPAVGVASLGLGFGITAFVMGLKQKNDTAKMIAVINFIYSVAIFALSILTFVSYWEV